jgi:hypothetical protein
MGKEKFLETSEEDVGTMETSSSVQRVVAQEYRKFQSGYIDVVQRDIFHTNHVRNHIFRGRNRRNRGIRRDLGGISRDLGGISRDLLLLPKPFNFFLLETFILRAIQ